MILIPFSATLNNVLIPESGHLPLSVDDTTRLLSIVPEKEEMLLTLNDGLYTEWIRVENQCGVIVIERGYDNSTAHRFPRGTCVKFETSLPVIKWLICNHDCCADEDCPCVAAESAGTVFPEAKINYPWEGTAVFKGDTPITFGVTGMPAWMSAEHGANYIRFSGTPAGIGTFNISIAATNCSGKYVAVQLAKLTVTAT